MTKPLEGETRITLQGQQPYQTRGVHKSQKTNGLMRASQKTKKGGEAELGGGNERGKTSQEESRPNRKRSTSSKKSQTEETVRRHKTYSNRKSKKPTTDKRKQTRQRSSEKKKASRKQQKSGDSNQRSPAGDRELGFENAKNLYWERLTNSYGSRRAVNVRRPRREGYKGRAGPPP